MKLKAKYKGGTFLKIITLFVFTGYIISCTNNPIVVPERDYPIEVLGSWLGVTHGLKEAITFKRDSTFACEVYPTGFIANTLSQGVKGWVYGKWKIVGATIILKITGEKNENVQNKTTQSTIVSFHDNELILKSDKGEVSSFERIKHE